MAIPDKYRADAEHEKFRVTGEDQDEVSVAVSTFVSNGVPEAYTQTCSSGRVFNIAKGQLNKLRLRPMVLNEHAESSREVQAVVASDLIVGQVFRASQDNINGIGLTLESNAGVALDNFESYANDGELQAVWILSGTNEATVETSIVKTGNQSMRLPSQVVDDEWQDTITSTDYTGYTFSFDFYASKEYNKMKFEFFIGDGINTKSFALVVDDKNTWVHFDVLEAAMTADAGILPDITAITEIGFRVVDAEGGANAGYIDNLVATPSPGSVDLKLWDFGTTMPEGGTDALDDATQYEELGDRGLNGGTVAEEINLSLQGGKRLYIVKQFVAGAALEIPENILLTPGNYYALTIHYVDTDVNVFGPNTAYEIDYYQSGYSFTAPDTSTAITNLGTYNDLMFGIFSTQVVYVDRFFQSIDETPGSGVELSVFIEDNNMKITGVSTIAAGAAEEILVLHETRPMIMVKGGKFEMYYNDDFTDDVSTVNLVMDFFYIPPTTYG